MCLLVGHQGVPLALFSKLPKFGPWHWSGRKFLIKFIHLQGIILSAIFFKIHSLFTFHASWYCMKLYLFPPSHPCGTLLSCSLQFYHHVKSFAKYAKVYKFTTVLIIVNVYMVIHLFT